MRIHRVFLLAACLAVLRIGATAQPANHDEIMSHYTRAEADLASGRSEEAAAEFRAILKLDPTNSQAFANLGVIAYKAGDFQEAVKLFSLALRNKPSLPDAKAFLGLSEVREGQAAKGLEALEAAYPNIRNSDLRIEAGVAIVRAHQDSKTLAEAVDVVRDLQTRFPANPEVLYVAYRTYSDLAAEAVSALSKSATDSSRMQQVLGEAAMGEDDFPNAIAHFRKAASLDPSLPGIHSELGRAIRANSQDDAALQEAQHEFSTQLASDPSDFNSELALAEVLRLRGKLDLAAEHYKTSLRLQPALADADLGLGNVLLDQGNAQEAIRYLAAGIQLDPKNQAAHFALAHAYRAVGRLQDANQEAALVQKLRQEHDGARSTEPDQPK